MASSNIESIASLASLLTTLAKDAPYDSHVTLASSQSLLQLWPGSKYAYSAPVILFQKTLEDVPFWQMNFDMAVLEQSYKKSQKIAMQ